MLHPVLLLTLIIQQERDKCNTNKTRRGNPAPTILIAYFAHCLLVALSVSSPKHFPKPASSTTIIAARAGKTIAWWLFYITSRLIQ